MWLSTVRTEAEPGGHGLVGETLCDQFRYLPFPRGQLGQPGGRSGRLRRPVRVTQHLRALLVGQGDQQRGPALGGLLAGAAPHGGRAGAVTGGSGERGAEQQALGLPEGRPGQRALPGGFGERPCCRGRVPAVRLDPAEGAQRRCPAGRQVDLFGLLEGAFGRVFGFFRLTDGQGCGDEQFQELREE